MLRHQTRTNSLNSGGQHMSMVGQYLLCHKQDQEALLSSAQLA